MGHREWPDSCALPKQHHSVSVSVVTGKALLCPNVIPCNFFTSPDQFVLQIDPKDLSQTSNNDLNEICSLYVSKSPANFFTLLRTYA